MIPVFGPEKYEIEARKRQEIKGTGDFVGLVQLQLNQHRRDFDPYLKDKDMFIGVEMDRDIFYQAVLEATHEFPNTCMVNDELFHFIFKQYKDEYKKLSYVHADFCKTFNSIELLQQNLTKLAKMKALCDQFHLDLTFCRHGDPTRQWLQALPMVIAAFDAATTKQTKWNFGFQGIWPYADGAPMVTMMAVFKREGYLRKGKRKYNKCKPQSMED